MVGGLPARPRLASRTARRFMCSTHFVLNTARSSSSRTITIRAQRPARATCDVECVRKPNLGSARVTVTPQIDRIGEGLPISRELAVRGAMHRLLLVRQEFLNSQFMNQ